MLTKYGHTKIEIGSEVFNLAPSLINISKMGDDKTIVDDFNMLINPTSTLTSKIITAINVLNCCSDKTLPESYTGKIEYVNNKFEYIPSDYGDDSINDIIILAIHLLKHGVCGVSQEDNNQGGKKLETFDPYEYIELARLHLGCNSEESKNITMTEFLRLMNAKFPKEKKEDENSLSIEQQRSMVEWAKQQGMV